MTLSSEVPGVQLQADGGGELELLMLHSPIRHPEDDLLSDWLPHADGRELGPPFQGGLAQKKVSSRVRDAVALLVAIDGSATFPHLLPPLVEEGEGVGHRQVQRCVVV